MSSRTRTLPAGPAERARRNSRGRGGLSSSSEKQTQAYLVARDVLRRIARTHALVAPRLTGGGDGCERLPADER